MKKFGKNLLIVPVLLALLLTITPTRVVVHAQESDTKEVVASIYPVPQAEELLEAEGIKLVGTVNLVIHGEQHDITGPAIKKLLDEHNIKYTESEAIDATASNIFISSDKSHCDLCGAKLADDLSALDESQGYILKSEKNNVFIVGSDKDGVFNGIQTFEQILDQAEEDGTITSVLISDYPSIKLRGYVEGFYGYPWTFEQRASMLKQVSKLKMNTYIYAPKDDPYHLSNWREPYPEKESQELAELAKIAHENNIDFVWSVHPGDRYNYSNDNDYNALIAKFESLYDLGIRQFGISYDDLGGSVSAAQHAGVINRVDKEWSKAKGDVKPIITVGTRYANVWGPNNYIGPFLQAFEDTETIVMMTGNGTMSPVKKEYFEWPKKQGNTKRDVAAWWNYPVNDYVNGNMMMAPLETVDNDVDNLAGFFLNPMSQAEASKVAIFSGADYSWNVGDFEATSSWKRAINEVTPDVNEAFERFADNISYLQDGVVFDESRYLTDLISEVNESLETGVNLEKSIDSVRAVFEQLQNDVELIKNMENKAMLAEVEKHLEAYEIVVEAGLNSVNALDGALNSDIKQTLGAIDLSNNKLIDADKVMIKSMDKDNGGHKDNKVNVFEKRVKPFIKGLNNHANSILMNSLFTEVNPEVKVNDKDTAAIMTHENGVYTVSGFDALHSGNNVTIKLAELTHIAQIKALGTNLNNVTVYTSINGHDWSKLDTTNSTSDINGMLNETIAYVKLEITDDVTIASIELKELQEVTGGKATTNMSRYDNHHIGNAFDNNMSTKFYSSSGSNVGSYIQVELNEAQNIYDASIVFATNPKGASEGIDGFKATKISYSNDGSTWTDISSKHMKDYDHGYFGTNPISKAVFSVDGVNAKYWRFTADETYGNWVQVYEVEFNKGVGEHISLVETTLTSGKPSALYDKDLSTYYEPTVVAGDSVEYLLTLTTSIEELVIIQDETKISNATVEVLGLDGTWKEIGILDAPVNTLTVKDKILRVRLTFNEAQPRIAEIIERGMKEVTDLSALELAINNADALILDEAAESFTTSSWSGFTEALDIAKAMTPDHSVAEVEQARALLEGAQANLAKRASDTTVSFLQKLVTRLNALRENYSELEFANMNVALEEAQQILDQSDDHTDLELNSVILKLTEYEQPLLDLMDEIVALDTLKQHIDVANLFLSEDTSNIRPAKLETLTQAVTVAQTLVDELNRDLTTINEATDAITNAMQNLWEIVDKTDLNSVIAIAEVLNSELYNSTSWTILSETLAEAKLIATNDDATLKDVNNAKAAILNAIDNLEVRLVDVSLVKEIETVKAILAHSDLYVPSTITKLTKALADAESILDNATTQAEIDQATSALIQEKLAVRLRADVSNLQRVVTRGRSIDVSHFAPINIKKLDTVLSEAEVAIEDPEVTQSRVNTLEVKVEDTINTVVEAELQSNTENVTPEVDSNETIDKNITKDKDLHIEKDEQTSPSTRVNGLYLPYVVISLLAIFGLTVYRKRKID